MTAVRDAVRSRPYLVDTAIAVFLLAGTIMAPPSRHYQSAHPLSWPTVAVAVAMGVALVFRRTWPGAVLAVNVAGLVTHLIVQGGARNSLDLLAAVALATLATHRPRRVSWRAAVLTGLVLAAARVAFAPDSLAPDLIGQTAWIVMATAAGEGLRSRRAYIAAIEERALRAEQTREEEAQRRVMEERLRIARELHDVLAHHISLINVQAQVASHVLDDEPRQAREALGHVRQAGKAALEELRTTVGLLRQPGAAEELPTEPAPGLDRLPELITSFTAAGLKVDCHLEGTPRPLPSPVELTAFRVVQEALTNVNKHARQASALVRISYGNRDLTIDVTDDGAGGAAAPPGSESAGHGLVGMRERALSVGGTFSVGPSPGSGFRVHAVLPAPQRSGV